MYHYVIIGAGSAGCVLANRLTEDPRTNVLLLEAGGPDRSRALRVPAAFPRLFRGPFDWAYFTEPQPELDNRQLYWPRGKVLGGCSSINAMVHCRASRQDHDLWFELGNKGWGYDEVLPYYKRCESWQRDRSGLATHPRRTAINNGQAGRSNSGGLSYHGEHGPLSVSDLSCANPMTRAFVEAGIEIGLRFNDDFNGEERRGVGFFQVTQKGGRRHSAAAAYLKPALSRPNLTVQTNVHVTRLLFDRQRAMGVEFVRDGRVERSRAENELILSAGAIGSPQLLMLSGVGDADDLTALGIPPLSHLPGVGRNLLDHLLVGAAYESREPVSLAGAGTPASLLKYLVFKAGPLTSNIGEAGAFLNARPGGRLAPDLEILFAPSFFMNHGFSNPDGHGFTIGAALQHPLSSGRISLRSADPQAAPAIDPCYLVHESDLDVLVSGLVLARCIAAAKAMDRYRGIEVWPGTEARSSEEISRFIRRTAETLYHPVGTCKMGADPMSVVDSNLRVHGIERLRIVDASVFPSHIAGHTNATVLMIAEKASDIIRGVPATPVSSRSLTQPMFGQMEEALF